MNDSEYAENKFNTTLRQIQAERRGRIVQRILGIIFGILIFVALLKWILL